MYTTVAPPPTLQPTLKARRPTPMLFFTLAHAPLGAVLALSPLAATAHASTTIILSLVLAVQTRRPIRLAQAAAYVAGSDVLWRMTGARFFHEGAKYVVAVLLASGLFRLIRRWRSVGLPVAYVAVAVPGVALTLVTVGASDEARQLISANLSGPVALAVAVIFFSQVRTTSDGLVSMMWFMLYPIVAVAGVAAVSTASAGVITFGDESNFVTSGGFGPNQVSALLGLGALLCVLIALVEERSRRQAALGGIAVLLLLQAALTFSRGGVVNVLAAVAATVAALLLDRQRRALGRLLGGLAVVIALGVWVVVPRLETFTEGAITERFSRLDSTNRSAFAATDFDIFQRNPIAGVGVGVSSIERGQAIGSRVSSHTEYTRLLAEHGMFGVFTVCLLLAMASRAIRRTEAGLTRAITAALFAWVLVDMAHSGMKIAAVPFVFALAVAGSTIRFRNGVGLPHRQVGLGGTSGSG